MEAVYKAIDSKKTCAVAQHTDCKEAVGKRSPENCGRTESGERHQDSGLLSSLASDESALESRPGRRNCKERGESQYGDVEGNRSTMPRCHEPDIDLGFASRVGSSTDTSSSDGACTREIAGSERVPAAIIKVTTTKRRWKNFHCKVREVR